MKLLSMGRTPAPALWDGLSLEVSCGVMFTCSVSHQTQAKRLKAYPSFRRVQGLCHRSFLLLCFWGLIAVPTKSVESHTIGRGLLCPLHWISCANKSWNRNLDLNICYVSIYYLQHVTVLWCRRDVLAYKTYLDDNVFWKIFVTEPSKMWWFSYWKRISSNIVSNVAISISI